MFVNRQWGLLAGIIWLAEKEVSSVNQLRQLMIEELQRRNFAETTIRSYVHGMEHFSRYFHRWPDQLGTNMLISSLGVRRFRELWNSA